MVRKKAEGDADRGAGRTGAGAADEPGRTFTGRGAPPYGEAHERVFRALVTVEEERPGAVHKPAAEVQETGTLDLGPRYEAKPRR